MEWGGGGGRSHNDLDFFWGGEGLRGGGGRLPRVVLGGHCRKPSQCHHHKVFSALSIQPYSTRRKQASLSHTYYVTKIPSVYIKFARTDKTSQCNRVGFGCVCFILESTCPWKDWRAAERRRSGVSLRLTQRMELSVSKATLGKLLRDGPMVSIILLWASFLSALTTILSVLN